MALQNLGQIHLFAGSSLVTLPVPVTPHHWTYPDTWHLSAPTIPSVWNDHFSPDWQTPFPVFSVNCFHTFHKFNHFSLLHKTLYTYHIYKLQEGRNLSIIHFWILRVQHCVQHNYFFIGNFSYQKSKKGWGRGKAQRRVRLRQPKWVLDANNLFNY